MANTPTWYSEWHTLKSLFHYQPSCLTFLWFSKVLPRSYYYSILKQPMTTSHTFWVVVCSRLHIVYVYKTYAFEKVLLSKLRNQWETHSCLYHEGTRFKFWSSNHLFCLALLCLCRMWTGTGIKPEYRLYMISSSSFLTLIYLLKKHPMYGCL